MLSRNEAGGRRTGVGDDGGVLALQPEAGTPVPGDLHRSTDGSGFGDSTSPGARPMTPGLEGGRVEVETRVDLHLARRRLESPSKPQACRTLRNLNLYGHVRSAWQNAPQCLSPSAS